MQDITDAFRNAWARAPLAVMITALALAALSAWAMAPEGHQAREARIMTALKEGHVVEIAKAEDGATLWAVKREGDTIYFSKGAVAMSSPSKDKGR